MSSACIDNGNTILLLKNQLVLRAFEPVGTVCRKKSPNQDCLRLANCPESGEIAEKKVLKLL
jgi:hypothetical protein